MFLVVIPVLVPYFTSLGLSMEQVFQLQAIFGFIVVLLEVPSGYLCDIWGRKRTMAIGAFLSGTGFTYLYFANEFWQLVLFEIIIGIALSLVSGADVSILYDSLDQVDHSRAARTKATANIQFSQQLAESTGAVLGGLLVTISFSAVVVTHAITSWIPFLISLQVVEPQYKKMQISSHRENFRKIFVHLFKTDALLTLVFVNMVVWGLSTFIAVWIFQKYWETEGIPLAYFGFLWAGYNLSVGIVGQQVHSLEERFGPIPLLLALSLFPIVGYFGMAFTSGWIGVLFGFSFQFSRGITHVILKDALNWRTPSEFRATVNSLSSLFFRLGFCLVGPLVGYLIDKFSLQFALQSVGVGFVCLFILVMIPLIRIVRKITPEVIPSE